MWLPARMWWKVLTVPLRAVPSMSCWPLAVTGMGGKGVPMTAVMDRAEAIAVAEA